MILILNQKQKLLCDMNRVNTSVERSACWFPEYKEDLSWKNLMMVSIIGIGSSKISQPRACLEIITNVGHTHKKFKKF